MNRGTIGLVVILAALPSLARAGALFVGEIGSQGQQRGGAFVAKADDPTAIYFNPAGLVKTRRYQLYLGGSVVDFHLKYQRTGSYADTTTEPHAWNGDAFPEVENDSAVQPIPFLAGAQRFGRLGLGQGVWAPQTFPNRDMPWEVETQNSGPIDLAPAPQRYDIATQRAIIALPSVAAAYRVLDWLDVGGRVSWGVGTLKATTAVWGMKNSAEDPIEDAKFTVDAKDYFFLNYGFGVLARPKPWLELGASFAAPMHERAKGTGTVPPLANPMENPTDPDDDFIYVDPVPDFPQCAAGGTRSELKACVNLDLPATATVGGRVILRDRNGDEKADLELDVQWQNWAGAQDIQVIVDGQDSLLGKRMEITYIKHGYQDVWSVRLGGSYRLALADNPLELRAGVSYDTAAAPLSWTRADMDGTERLLGAVGVAYDFGRVRVDVGGAYVRSADRTVEDVAIGAGEERVQPDVVQPLTRDQDYHPINAGEYSSGYLIANVGVTASW